jgi:hypothetical protein
MTIIHKTMTQVFDDYESLKDLIKGRLGGRPSWCPAMTDRDLSRLAELSEDESDAPPR